MTLPAALSRKAYLRFFVLLCIALMTVSNVQIVAKDVIAPYHLYLRSDGILYIQISSEKEETVELAQQMVGRMGTLVGGKQVPVLARFEAFALPGKANRDFWAKKESCPFSKAEAFIISSVALQFIANFYLKFNKPERPTRMFTKEDEAVRWLKSFL